MRAHESQKGVRIMHTLDGALPNLDGFEKEVMNILARLAAPARLGEEASAELSRIWVETGSWAYVDLIAREVAARAAVYALDGDWTDPLTATHITRGLQGLVIRYRALRGAHANDPRPDVAGRNTP